MTTTTAPLRPATITRALKAAGFTQSNYLRSGAVRGWGTSTEGFEVEGEKKIHYSHKWHYTPSGKKYWPQRSEYTGIVFVTYEQSTNISATYKPGLNESKLREIQEALENLGYSVDYEADYMRTGRLVVKREA